LSVTNFKGNIKLTAAEVFDPQNCPTPQTKQFTFSLL